MNSAAPEANCMQIQLCRFDEMPIGIGMVFDIRGQSIALFRTRGGAVYALDNACPHRGGPLADGIITGHQIVCPLHAHRFSLHDGSCESGGVCNTRAHTTHVADGWVLIEMPVPEKAAAGHRTNESGSLATLTEPAH